MKNPDLMLRVTLLLVSSLTIMSVITISPALSAITQHFSNESNANFLVKMVLTIPALLIALVSPIAGRLIDRYGRMGLLRFALVLYALAGTAGFYLENLYVLLTSRAVLGFAVGISMTVVVTLVADYFEGPARQKFVGLQVAFMSLGGIFFLAIGGLLADFSWRYTFLMYLFSLVVLPFVLVYLKEPDVKKQMGTGATASKSPGIIWVFFFNTLVIWLLFFLIPVQMPFYLPTLGVEKKSLIGLAIATGTAFSALSSMQFARIHNRVPFLGIFGMGYLLMAAGFGLAGWATSYAVVIVAMMLTGLGMGLMIPNTNMWVMKVAPPQIRGKEIGKLTTFWFLGQFLSPILLFPVVQALGISGSFLDAAIVLLVLSLAFFIWMGGKRNPANS